jgi:hypothetical protein
MKQLLLGLCCGSAFTLAALYLLAVWWSKDVYR